METPPSATEHVHFQVASTFESIEVVVERAQDFAEAHFNDEDAAYAFVLLASEAVTNAVTHGNKSDPEKHITVEFLAFPDRAELAVTDEGEGFSRDEIEDPLEGENLTRTHGRGLFLIEEMADDVAYEDEGRRIRITLKRA